MDDARREEDGTHDCWCRLINQYGREDMCGVGGLPADQPFCKECEDAGHPSSPMQQPRRVVT